MRVRESRCSLSTISSRAYSSPSARRSVPWRLARARATALIPLYYYRGALATPLDDSPVAFPRGTQAMDNLPELRSAMHKRFTPGCRWNTLLRRYIHSTMLSRTPRA